MTWTGPQVGVIHLPYVPLRMVTQKKGIPPLDGVVFLVNVEPGILFSNFLYCNIISFVFILLILLLITTCFRNTDAKVCHPRSPTASYCALQRFDARCCRLLHVIGIEIVAQVQKIS